MKEVIAMANYGSTDRVRKTAAEQYIAPARRRSESTVTIHSGDFAKLLVQGKVLPPNRFPIICNALQSKKFLRENHLTLKDVQGPPSGKSSTVKFIYKIEPLPPGNSPAARPSNAAGAFLGLRGIMKSAYRKLGGAEAFHRHESESWNR
jgi:hypothetical protein